MSADNILDLRGKREPPQTQKQSHEVAAETHANRPEPKEVIISWEAMEFAKKDKDKMSWIFFILGGGVAISALLLLLHNLIGASVSVLGAAVLLIYAFQEPRRIHFSITSQGFKVGQKLYPWEKIESFWIFFEPGQVKELSLRFTSTFSMDLRVPLGNQNPVEVRRAMLMFVPEVEQAPSAIDLLMRRIGF